MTILYCDCYSGISGDMFLGALLDAGLPQVHLEGELRKLDLAEFGGVSARRVQRGALAASLLELDLRPEHGEPGGHAHHRHFDDIRRLIEASGLAPRVQEASLAVFQKLAEAEARVHGVTVESVHFHEVGAADSIVDIVGAAVGLAFFGVEAVYASSLPLGGGEVSSQHGLLPLPAPATLELLRLAGAPIRPAPGAVELVTPTGAAILAALARFEMPEMRLQRVGIGTGRRELPWPNILRLWLGEPDEPAGAHVEIETNIDDMNPQILGRAMALLFQAGALDVYFTPIYMKKNRPAVKLAVIARRQDETALCDLLLRETSTLGVRITPLQRREAGREMRRVPTAYGEVPVKLKLLDGKVVQAAPEFDACAHLADAHDAPLSQLLHDAAAAAMRLYGESG